MSYAGGIHAHPSIRLIGAAKPGQRRNNKLRHSENRCHSVLIVFSLPYLPIVIASCQQRGRNCYRVLSPGEHIIVEPYSTTVPSTSYKLEANDIPDLDPRGAWSFSGANRCCTGSLPNGFLPPPQQIFLTPKCRSKSLQISGPVAIF